MRRICVPKKRAGGLAGALRWLWTLPTNCVGHVVARAFGCGSPARLGGSAVKAWLYTLPPGKAVGLAAIALGHVVLTEPAFMADERRPWLLAHELSHTRQHDWLGPLYLPAHGAFMLLSVMCSLIRPIAGYPPQHAYNPLERVMMHVPFDILVESPLPQGDLAARTLAAFGCEDVPV
jgi:hypothetical protein